MKTSFADRIVHAFNVFLYGDSYISALGPGRGFDIARYTPSSTSGKSIIMPVINRIGIDVAAVGIRHARTDENGNFRETIYSKLNDCLTLNANVDQTGRAFIQDAVMSLCDDGVIAIVAVETTENPGVTASYDVKSLRVGEILEWFPAHVRVRLYNERTGHKEDIVLTKQQVAIVQNPLYSVMNEPNSTLRRLVDKLTLLDAVDKQSGSGKLDVIIQLPYMIKSETRKKQADARRQAIAEQLEDSQYGIAYVDGTEKIVQLNRPAENNLMAQVEYLTRMLYSQLGMTQSIFEGTAEEPEMLAYYNRTIEPIIGAILDSMTRTFLSKTAITQYQRLMAIRDPFKLVPSEKLAEMADKFGRNEIVTPNEFRAVLGMGPSKDPTADELRNRNLNEKAEPPSASTEKPSSPAELTADLAKFRQNGRSKLNAQN